MELIRFEIKPNYYLKKSIRIISLLIAFGIVVFGLVKPNYYIIVVSLFFFLIPMFTSFRYLKLFNNSILIESIGVFPFFSSSTKIELDKVVELSYNGKESRIIKALFSGNAIYHNPEDVQPVIEEHIIFKYENGKDYKLFKIGSSEEFKIFFDIISGSESILRNNPTSNKGSIEESVEIENVESITKSTNRILEIKPLYKIQLVLKYILLGFGISLGIISQFFSSLSDYAFFAFIFIIIGSFYTLFSSKRHIEVYEDRVVFEDISVLKTFSETTTVLLSQVQDISYMKRQFLIFGARVSVASADNQTLYNENRIVFKLKNKKVKVVKQTGDKNEFYSAYLKIENLVGKTNHNSSSNAMRARV